MKITEKVKTVIMGLAAVATLGTATLIAPVVSAATDDGTASSTKDYDPKSTTYTKTEGGEGVRNQDLMGTLQVIINVVLGLIGFIAVAMIIVGGVQYTTSAGDAAKVTKAKNTILYGVVGLVIAMLAFAIVNFILTNVFKTS